MSISAERFRLLLVAGCAALAACGQSDPEPPRAEQARQPAAQPSDAQEPVEQAAPAAGVSGARAEDAAEVLKRYFSLIGERRYEEARRLREPGRKPPSAAEFAANFDAFAEHRATVGQPSRIAEAGEWLYVEVPVQRYGKYRSGAAFGNAGTVTLRRRKAGDDAEWRIYTSG